MNYFKDIREVKNIFTSNRQHEKVNLEASTENKDSDQTAHLRSLIRAFTFYLRFLMVYFFIDTDMED